MIPADSGAKRERQAGGRRRGLFAIFDIKSVKWGFYSFLRKSTFGHFCPKVPPWFLSEAIHSRVQGWRSLDKLGMTRGARGITGGALDDRLFYRKCCDIVVAEENVE